MKNELFGESIKDIRLNLNLTQNQVAETANINRITISRIENEVIPDLTTLEYLSLIYKCNLVELYSNYFISENISFYETQKFNEKYK